MTVPTPEHSTTAYCGEESMNQGSLSRRVNHEVLLVLEEAAAHVSGMWGMSRKAVDRALVLLHLVSRVTAFALVGAIAVSVLLRTPVSLVTILIVGVFVVVLPRVLAAVVRFSFLSTVATQFGIPRRPIYAWGGRRFPTWWDKELEARLETEAIARLKARGELPETYARSSA